MNAFNQTRRRILQAAGASIPLALFGGSAAAQDMGPGALITVRFTLSPLPAGPAPPCPDDRDPGPGPGPSPDPAPRSTNASA